MKNLKKILAAVLAVMMIGAMAVGAISSFAAGHSGVTIEIERDSTYAGDTSGSGRVFTYYKIFSVASYGTYSGATGGGYNTTTGSGTAPDGSGTVAYTATSSVAGALGAWVEAGVNTDDPATTDVDESKAHWEKKTGNLWFDLAPISGTNPLIYSVTWAKGVATDTDTVQAAATWLIKNNAYETGKTGKLDFADGKWSKEVERGYYVIESVAGKNLIAATTDITIKEKNAYPPLDKTQKDADDGEEFGDTSVKVAVGDVINYEVKVTIPVTAAVGDKIVVWDKASKGLTYNKDVIVKTNAGNATVEPGTKGSNYTGEGTNSSADWNQLITVTAGSQGKDVVFSFSMTVDSDAIVDTEKENESGLKYGRDSGSTPIFPYESEPDKVAYTTYFGGIYKFDGADKKALEGVKFDLFEMSGTEKIAYNVVKDAKGYYLVGGNDNEVITDASGTIHIRGLDEDKTYVLTETETLSGYNMLDHDVTLELHIDETSVTTYTPVESVDDYNSTVTYYVKSGNDYVEYSGTSFKEGLYTKSTSTSGSYDTAKKQQWEVKVENNKGSLLPSTGGIGTTIFYVVGAVLVIGSGIVLVTKKRMGKEEN